jgi:hypothetical protein
VSLELCIGFAQASPALKSSIVCALLAELYSAVCFAAHTMLRCWSCAWALLMLVLPPHQLCFPLYFAVVLYSACRAALLDLCIGWAQAVRSFIILINMLLFIANPCFFLLEAVVQNSVAGAMHHLDAIKSCCAAALLTRSSC